MIAVGTLNVILMYNVTFHGGGSLVPTNYWHQFLNRSKNSSAF